MGEKRANNRLTILSDFIKDNKKWKEFMIELEEKLDPEEIPYEIF